MNGNPRTDGPSQENQAQDAATATASSQTPPEPQEAAPAVDPERERLESELNAARRRVDQLARAYQELERDREEFKQRLMRERERMMDVERGNVAVLLLEAVDELDRAMSGADASSPLTQGVKMIRDGLLSKLQQSGIERIQVVGQPYNPNTAEATDMEITTNPDDDQKVVAEARAGYRLKDRIIRPARVKVAKYVAPAQA